MKKARKPDPPRKKPTKVKATTLRIIGGDMGGRKLKYNGDLATRPMRDAVREALFNIVGTRIKDATIFDPFSGTGILVAESLSRGASAAYAMEFNRRTFKQIEDNLGSLDLMSRTTLVMGDAFRGLGALMQEAAGSDWIFFLCPPYEMYESRLEDLNKMMRMAASIGKQGLMVSESENHFDTAGLIEADWRVKKYGIAQLAFAEFESIATE